MKTLLSMLITLLMLQSLTPAADFKPTLDQTREVITGAGELQPTIPPGAPEATRYSLPTGTQRNLLIEVPGKPFKQVDPMPPIITWWKTPLYLAIGLPRDTVDMIAGGISYIPFISNIEYVLYEKVPVQIFMRDPTDWHRWDGTKNRKNHGFYDGDSWGWFPSANAWKLTHPSPWKAKRNAEYNKKLQKQLDELNAAADTANLQLAKKQQEARTAALEALKSGKSVDPTGAAAGKEASSRMVPYYLSTRLDDGAFALLMTSLALYEDSPKWAEELLWSELRQASPARLEATRQLLQEMTDTYRVNLRARRALILINVLLGDADKALVVAKEYVDPEPGKPMQNRLVFETAIAAGQTEQAQSALESMKQNRQFADEQPLMQDRLMLASGQTAPARVSLQALKAAKPMDAYLNYYLGIADLQRAEEGNGDFVTAVDAAQQELDLAVQGAPGPVLRNAAGQALSVAREAKTQLAGKTEITAPKPSTAERVQQELQKSTRPGIK